MLVATSVIEVGIDVANATVMLIEDADRYGLSQLHQLRGRVGRGEHECHCILFADPESERARRRLEAIARERDGFELAEVDLTLRGEGEILGTRQHGLPRFRVAELPDDAALLAEARREVLELLRAPRRPRGARARTADRRRPRALRRRARGADRGHEGRRRASSGAARLGVAAESARDVRPTSDRVREALFSILGDVAGLRVLDLFCGTGALGDRGDLARRGSARRSSTRELGAARRNVADLGLGDRCELVRCRRRPLPRARATSASTSSSATRPIDSPTALSPSSTQHLPPRLASGRALAVESSARRPIELDLPLVAERRSARR